MLFKKTFPFLIFFLVLSFFLISIFSKPSQYYGFNDFSTVFAMREGDEKCELPHPDGKGGKCLYFNHEKPYGPCGFGGQSGEIEPGLCMSEPTNLKYRCCVPLEEEEEEEEEEDRKRVYSDGGCEIIGGDCQWTERGATSCTVDGQPGCFFGATCRAQYQDYADNRLYRCCLPLGEGSPGEKWCGEGVDYSKWENVYFNGSCPFSKSPSGSQLYCSLGPHALHHENTVDVLSWRNYGDGIGTEYFVAPERLTILDARQYYTVGTQKCGGDMKVETVSGVVYDIKHIVPFEAVLQHFVDGGGSFEVDAGTVLARIAERTDNGVIEFRDSPSCATGPHFHVEIESGVGDTCADCYFVDRWGCDLRNNVDPTSCGRCNRYGAALPTQCDCCSECGTCPQSSRQYCCDKDCVIIDDVKQCKAKH